MTRDRTLQHKRKFWEAYCWTLKNKVQKRKRSYSVCSRSYDKLLGCWSHNCMHWCVLSIWDNHLQVWVVIYEACLLLKKYHSAIYKGSQCQNHCQMNLISVYSAEMSDKPPVLTSRKNTTIIHTKEKNHKPACAQKKTMLQRRTAVIHTTP